MRLFANPRRPIDERLLWSRDTRFVHRLASLVPDSRVLELDSGAIVISPASELTELVASSIAREARAPEYGLVTIDDTLPGGGPLPDGALGRGPDVRSRGPHRDGPDDPGRSRPRRSTTSSACARSTPWRSSRSWSWPAGSCTSTSASSGRTCRCSRSRSDRSCRRPSIPTAPSSSTCSSCRRSSSALASSTSAAERTAGRPCAWPST